MATDLLKNILTRIEKVAEIERFPDWFLMELKGFDSRWSNDFLVDVNNPDKPGTTKTESFKLVRVRHRLPHKRWIYGGGFRYHPDVTLSQMESHAIEMSIKKWMMGIPEGGSKGGITIDPTRYGREDLIAITTKAIDKAIEYNQIGPNLDRWAPDVGTDEEKMEWMLDHFADEMRKHGHPEPAAPVTGKPIMYGGMPERTEATGRGLHYALRLFRKELGLKLPQKPTAILQGFGNVGFHFAKLAEEEFGIKIVGVLDAYGGVYHPNLPLKELLRYAKEHPKRSVVGFHEICKGDYIKTPEELFSIKADIAIPAALEETITPAISKILNCKILLEAANGPTLPEADPILEERKILVIPDVFNAGGVTVSFFEWTHDVHREPFFDQMLEIPRSRTGGLVFASLHEAMTRNGKAIIDIQRKITSEGTPISFRLASYIYALRRVLPFFAAKRRKELYCV